MLRLLRGPLSLHEIGRELDVSINTIKSHTRAIYRKLGAAGRRDAIQHARQLGILLPRNRHSPADDMLRLRPPRQPDPTPRLSSGRSAFRKSLQAIAITGACQSHLRTDPGSRSWAVRLALERDTSRCEVTGRLGGWGHDEGSRP